MGGTATMGQNQNRYMFRSLSLTIMCICLAGACFAQKEKDTLATKMSEGLVDYEELFTELENLIDSLSTPRSFTLVNLNLGQSYLSYQTKALAETRRRFTYSPSVGYYDKAGYGLSVGAVMVNDGSGLNPYQYSLAGSFDFQKNKAFITGLSLTHFITKGDLPFYTSPLQNEVFAYFTYRKSWLKPSVSFSYGWGNRDDFEEVDEKIQNINLAQNGFTRINTTERMIDFNLTASVRHDFYFLNALDSDYIRLTPQLSFTSGSQQFGFNQTANSYITVRRTGRNILYNTQNIAFDDAFYFQPISLTAFLKAELTKGKFFFQPQLLLDYYFPTATQKFTPAFLLNVGLLF